jgi:hypothetical protein
MQKDKIIYYNLFLDDIRTPHSAYMHTSFREFLLRDWKIVRSYKEFVDYITRNWNENKSFPELIAFDHDLADDHYYVKGDDWYIHSSEQMGIEETGYDCAKWLVDFCMNKDLKLPEFYCHSMNPVGKQNILTLLGNFKKEQDGEG